MTFIIDGEPSASSGNKAGYTAADECFCPALRFSLDAKGEVDTTRSDGQEPIAGDVRVKDAASAREANQPDLSFHQPVLEYMKLKLLAGLMGVGFDELAQRDKVALLKKPAQRPAAPGALRPWWRGSPYWQLSPPTSLFSKKRQRNAKPNGRSPRSRPPRRKAPR